MSPKTKELYNKTINGRTIELSNLDKIFFPKSHFTKGDVIDYYEHSADYFLHHVRNRIIVMHRYPDGIEGEHFYQKQVPEYFPDRIHRKTITLKKGDEQTLVVIQDKETLVYLANQGVLVYHAWLSSIDKPHYPNKIVFDFDPSDNDIQKLQFAVHKVKECLEEHKLTPFVMTTGSRGYHVAAPLIRKHSFEIVHEFTKKIAHTLTHAYPDLLTITMSKSERRGRVFIDYLRNSYGQTSVAPYSLRAKEGAPVATPLDWDEFPTTPPQKYTIKNIFKRLGHKKDPWKDFEKQAKKLVLSADN